MQQGIQTHPKNAIFTFLDAQAVYYRLYETQHVNSAAGPTAQPSSLGKVLATVMRVVCVCVCVCTNCTQVLT